MTTKVPVRLSVKHGSVLLSGSVYCGKTFALKLIAKRFAQHYSTAAVFVIDPINEYKDIAKDCGLNIIPIDGKVTGLDDRSIITINQSSKSTNQTDLVADILEHVWNRINKMPQDRLKLVILDDVQVANKTLRGKVAIDIFQRVGKKFNVLFLTSVQNSKNIDSELVDAFGTQIYMMHGIVFPFESLKPTSEQKAAIFKRGCGLLSNDDQRIYVNFE